MRNTMTGLYIDTAVNGEAKWGLEGIATVLPAAEFYQDSYRASAAVSPLTMAKHSAPRSRSAGVRSTSSSHTRQSSERTQRTVSTTKSPSNPSPPLTPRSSRDGVTQMEEESESTFHNYMRAFYPFHPSSTVSSSTDASSITVPINQGDVILVHSVHPNGWADGTLLASGARGWLPTNYCEGYDHDAIRSLLNALTQLWDLVKNNQVDNLAAFTRQDYVRAIIAGVRIFLVSALKPKFPFRNIGRSGLLCFV